MDIEAAIVLDSKNNYNNRLTTFLLRFPKSILAEFNTHRVLSRSASSSRAVTTAKYLEEVRSDALRFTPIYWGKNVPGMQAKETLTGLDLAFAKTEWKKSALSAADHAEKLLNFGVHKQTVNRILEPFLYVNVVVTATDFMNFFGLRLDTDAQPEIRQLALLMYRAYKKSIPEYRSWHLPFITSKDINYIFDNPKSYGDILSNSNIIPMMQRINNIKNYEETLIKISVARCARTSYKSHATGKLSTSEEDMLLYDRLLSKAPIHASPAEHIARPDTKNIFGFWKNKKLHGNFTGFQQFRKMLPGESLAPMPEDFDELFDFYDERGNCYG